MAKLLSRLFPPRRLGYEGEDDAWHELVMRGYSMTSAKMVSDRDGYSSYCILDNGVRASAWWSNMTYEDALRQRREYAAVKYELVRKMELKVDE